MSINSNKKGKVGELEWSKVCKDHGFPYARRSQQYAGYNGDADVIGVPNLHMEVKRTERLNVSKALEQAREDVTDNNIPMVAHRKNREEWMVIMGASDFLSLYREYLDLKGIEDVEV